jgi:hypothetical protein
MLILAGFSAALQPAVATFDAWKNLSQTSTIASNLSPHKAEQVAVSGNNVYAVWEDGSSDIFFSKSTDNGAHFSAPVNISNDSDDSTEPQIAAVGNSVYVIWTIQLSPSGTQIAFNASHDGGKTFDGKFVLTGAANTALYPRIAATSSTVSVVWEEVIGGTNPDVYYRKSTNGGVNFDSTVNLSNDSAFSGTPWISAASSNVYIVWFNATLGNDEILYVKSADSGATFGSITDLSNTPSHSLANPFVYSSQANVLVVWSDGDTPDILLSRSIDSGSAFNTPSNVSNNNSGESWGPQIIALGTDALATWYDDSSGDSEIFVKRLSSILPASSTRVVSDAFSIADTLDRGGTLTLKKVSSTDNTQLLPGAKFTITPNPFTMTSSLTIQDGDLADPDNTADGIIKLKNVGVGTYTIEEVQTPSGFDRIVQTITTSVHRTQPDPIVIIENKPAAPPITQPINVPSPDLDNNQLNTFILRGAKVNGVAVNTVSDLPDASLAPANQVPTLATVSFVTAAEHLRPGSSMRILPSRRTQYLKQQLLQQTACMRCRPS